MSQIKTPKIQSAFGGLTNIGRVAFVAFLAITMAGGCHKKSSPTITLEEGIEPSDPEVAKNLDELTTELRHTTQHHHAITTFDQFKAADPDFVVPPPPPGQKYAIGQGWRIVLVQDKPK